MHGSDVDIPSVYLFGSRSQCMVTLGNAVAGAVGIAGGFALALGGWSSMSLGARSLFISVQLLSCFAMYGVYLATHMQLTWHI